MEFCLGYPDQRLHHTQNSKSHIKHIAKKLMQTALELGINRGLHTDEGLAARWPTLAVHFCDVYAEAQQLDSQWGRCGKEEASEGFKRRNGISHLFFADDVLLFAEAIEDQIDCILGRVNKFCKASGQRINFGKSSISFSSNLLEAEILNLSTKLWVKRTMELGVYFGHNVHLQGHTNRANNKLLERVRERLDGWKFKTRLQAG